MHWTFGKEIMLGAGLALLINLFVFSIIEKNKSLIHYLLFLFVLQWLIDILTPPHEILWWIDLSLSFVITLVGAGHLLKLRVLEKTKSE